MCNEVELIMGSIEMEIWPGMMIWSMVYRQTISMTLVRHRLVCEFDEFTEDTPSNRLTKCAITNLLRHSDVSAELKRYLKFLRSSLDSVPDVGYRKIPPQ